MSRDNEFTRYCEKILKQAEKEVLAIGGSEGRNFFEILMDHKNELSKEEVQDEVSTLIFAVG